MNCFFSRVGLRTYQHHCTMGTGSLPGLEMPGRGVDQSAEVKERVKLYFSPFVPSLSVLKCVA